MATFRKGQLLISKDGTLAVVVFNIENKIVWGYVVMTNEAEDNPNKHLVGKMYRFMSKHFKPSGKSISAIIKKALLK